MLTAQQQFEERMAVYQSDPYILERIYRNADLNTKVNISRITSHHQNIPIVSSKVLSGRVQDKNNDQEWY